MYTRYYKPLSKVVFFSDFAILNTALVITHYLLFSYPTFSYQTGIFFILSNVSWLIISFFNKNLRLSEATDVNDVVDTFLISVICQLLLVSGVIYFFHIIRIANEVVLISFLLFFFLVIVHRLLLIMAIKRNTLTKVKGVNAVVLGSRAIATPLVSALSNHGKYAFDAENYFDEDLIDKIGLTALLNDLLRNKPDEIFVCYKNAKIDFIETLISFGDKHGIKILVLYAPLKNKKRNILNYRNVPITYVNAPDVNDGKIKLLKRAFDVTFSGAVMTLGLPVYMVLYLTTKITSKGPAIYRQERIGKDEKPFYIYKFRSMYVDAEKFGPQLAKENDPRVTKWGLVMRKTRLDELPQFWNVLRGDMSIVGHRPERRYFIDEIAKKTPQYRKLLVTKPGVTSLGQIQYGYAENVDQMCERLNYDLLYAHNTTLNFDINIILKTVRVMVEGRGK